ncbi:protein MpUGT23 [Marchantia polymorpha subsp. ruderalis]|uniref:Glycosyltransferase n=2 Tax=Marchantia polymorpha TaxID=3197 RepID=A0AAF6BJ71_MARPO|nr:hypothetical protein MARPO_0117s0008 [Marchantia polymorpha]BBN12055.1 hypothetical protein Mp_5g16980 [Marchantia polymorpha subsp. ruderalis]|eukprot:PTQ30928.1 hypothetical protein MARPO_0117s0008 [Marchantia polymorpha]
MAPEGVEQRRPHLLMVPLEEQGHFVVYVQLLYYLSRFDIRVTVCSTTKRNRELAELQSRGAFKDLDLRLEDAFFESDAATRANQVGATPALWTVVSDMNDQFKPYLSRLLDEQDPDAKPSFMLADFFLTWAQEAADKLNIPRYMMFTTPAWAAWSTMTGKVENWEARPDDPVTPPGMFSMRIGDCLPPKLPSLVDFRDAAGLLCNSFEELEGGMTDALRALIQKHPTSSGKVTKVLPIGPMLRLPGNPDPDAVEHGSSDCLKWLDLQAPASVLYVALGTQAKVGVETFAAIAQGLEASGVPFLWALRLSPGAEDLSSVLLPAFIERTKGRGFVETKFAPQLQILNHPSTGGHLSHCGWNSTIESICTGVPVISLPLHGDQPLNARALAEMFKTGLTIPKPNGVLAGDDVLQSIRSVMLGEEGLQLRRNAQGLKKAARASQEEGGSSNINVKCFVEEVLASVS